MRIICLSDNPYDDFTAILLQFYDHSQVFDSINLKEAISDLYNTGVNDDNLALIQKTHEKIYMAVKSSYGLSDRQIIRIGLTKIG